MGHRVNVLPGLSSSVVHKSYMVQRLLTTYGDGAFLIIPPTFRLPQHSAELAAYVETPVSPLPSSGGPGLWPWG